MNIKNKFCAHAREARYLKKCNLCGKDYKTLSQAELCAHTQINHQEECNFYKRINKCHPTFKK